MKLAVVIPIYNEQENLPELRRRLVDALDQLPDVAWQVIYVNDGSSDQSLALMLQQHLDDPRFAVVELSRNFGHQAAITAGLAHAEADAVVLMDGDLQDPPEVIPELVAAWRDGGQVVLAQRRSRQERGIRRLGMRMFYFALDRLSDYPIPTESGIFGLLDRQALTVLKRLPERNRFLPGMRAWIGFQQRTVWYDRQARAAGAPKQSLWKLFWYGLDGILSFSYKPLRMMVVLGSIISSVGFAVALAFIIRRLGGWEIANTGFTTVITMILFLGGVQLIAIGLLGEYLGRIYEEVKNRPIYIVSATHGLAAAGERPGKDVGANGASLAPASRRPEEPQVAGEPSRPPSAS